MPYNGTGTFTPVYSWQTDAANGILVRADRMDTETVDIANGLSNCMTRDGQSSATGTQNFGGQKLINLANGSSSGDAVNYGQVFTAPAFTGSGSITGNWTVGGALAVTGAATIGGNTTIAGSATIGTGLTVTTGSVSMSGATSVTVPTVATTDNSTNAASTAYVTAKAFVTALPGQTGVTYGFSVITNGTAASWGMPPPDIYFCMQNFGVL